MTRTLQAIVAAMAVLLLLFAALYVRSCQQRGQMAAQSKVDRGQTEALGNSARDAIETQGKANERERESEGLTKSNEKEIRDAPGANDPVNPAARDAGLRSLCRRSAYRNNERCRLLVPRAP